ncbi:MAG: TIGR03032 family protein, partial [Actinobacteria bacterium]|nr:TIGR03032 family protein [Actinomycetota bacterium]
MVEADEVAAPVTDASPPLTVVGSPGLPGWLGERSISLLLTTYQAGRVFLIGGNPGNRLSVFQRAFSRCMGLSADPDGSGFWLATQFQIWRFADGLPHGGSHNNYDRVYVPRYAHTTGSVDTHDLSGPALFAGQDHSVVFISTAFNCLATLSEKHSFRVLWKPPFISAITPEDRCHLNGLATESGRPRYVTAVSTDDVADGWRAHRMGGGVVLDLDSNQIVARGLSMPHSPRLHGGTLWALDAGTGYFGRVDTERGEFEPMTFLAGFARGMALVDDHAIVAVSKARESGTFGDLGLADELARRGLEPQCGLRIIELSTGKVVQWLSIEGVVSELYDVAVLNHTHRPMALGLQTDE